VFLALGYKNIPKQVGPFFEHPNLRLASPACYINSHEAKTEPRVAGFVSLGASVVQGKRGSRRRTMEGAASWHRRLLDAVDIDASEVLDNVLHPLVNVSTSDEAREDAFHDKVIRVCRAGMRKRGHVSAPPREPRGCTRECDSRNTFTKSAACTAPQSERGASTCTVLRGTVVPYP